MQYETSRLVHEIRVGNLKAGVWMIGEQDPHPCIMFSRVYEQDEEWKHLPTFTRDDLRVVAKIADLAHSWLQGQQDETSKLRSQNRVNCVAAA